MLFIIIIIIIIIIFYKCLVACLLVPIIFEKLDAFIFGVEVTLVIIYQTIRCHLSEQ